MRATEVRTNLPINTNYRKLKFANVSFCANLPLKQNQHDKFEKNSQIADFSKIKKDNNALGEFEQIINYDKKSPKRLLLNVKTDFLENFLDRLINQPKRKILISITGESASGKSTICNSIKKYIEENNLPISILNTDNYFNDISDLIKQYGTFDALRDSGYDVDSPLNFQLDLLREDIEKLAQGENVKIPQYLVNGTGISIPKAIDVESKKIIIVEGMAATYKEVHDMFDIKIYIDLDNKTRKKRFLDRAKERNQDHANALKHWDYVCKAGKKYVIPAKDNCDIIANGECDLEYLKELLGKISVAAQNLGKKLK